MDRSLDEIINERPRGGRARQQTTRGGGGGDSVNARGPRRDYERPPRDGVQKYSQRERDSSTNINSEWMHDKYDDVPEARRGPRNARSEPHARYDEAPSRQGDASANRLRVENLHYEIGETELKELFARIGPVQSVKMLYDRNDRSQGTAFVTYEYTEDARAALREYDGANAYGQPIRLELAAPPNHSRPARNPFDNVEKPSRSLFDRIGGNDDGAGRGRRDGGGRRRGRSASPGRNGAPDGVDRYVPGQDGDRRRSPARGSRRGTPRESGRRPGARREDSNRGESGRGGRSRGGGDGRQAPQGRPRKTAEELDAEMNDYFGGSGGGGAAANEAATVSNGEVREPQIATISGGENAATGTTSTINANDDIDLMVE